jgi:hypothetical protein
MFLLRYTVFDDGSSQVFKKYDSETIGDYARPEITGAEPH